MEVYEVGGSRDEKAAPCDSVVPQPAECKRLNPAFLVCAGARQQIFRLYNATNSSDPDVKFVEGSVGDYEEQLRTHKFCMAPW